MRIFLWILIGSALLVALRLVLIRSRFLSTTVDDYALKNSENPRTINMRSPPIVISVDYGAVPKDIENFSQQASVLVEESGTRRNHDFLVATPRGLAAVLEKQHENAMMLNAVVVVERFDRDSIRQAVELNLPRIIAANAPRS